MFFTIFNTLLYSTQEFLSICSLTFFSFNIFSNVLNLILLFASVSWNPSIIIITYFIKIANAFVQGENLNLASDESDVNVTIGTLACNVTSLASTQLVCSPPEIQPMPTDELGIKTETGLPLVVVSKH